jgi:hypothetical protein
MIEHVVIEADLAEPADVDEWRQAMARDGSGDAIDELDAGVLVLATLYVEAAYGPGDDDVVGLTMTAVELRRSDDEQVRIEDEWIADALAESASQLADERAIDVTEDELRAALTVRLSAPLMAALSGSGGG